MGTDGAGNHGLPAGVAVLTRAGAAGPKYWQNRADSDLHATLNSATRTVHGAMTLRCTNNPPGTLRVMWLPSAQEPNERITRSASVTFQVAWQFVMIAEHGRGRMGRPGQLYDIAQWDPRVNVYDDGSGWNTEPYTTGAELSLEYGDFSLAVTSQRATSWPPPAHRTTRTTSSRQWRSRGWPWQLDQTWSCA